jgi:hypothetical protein
MPIAKFFDGGVLDGGVLDGGVVEGSENLR